MNSIPKHLSFSLSRYSERGAVLYVALIMLLLISLIGLAGMRVASMQERMSSNYYATNRAFQRVEGLVRNTECGLESLVNDTGGTAGCNVVNKSDISGFCTDGYDAQSWVAGHDLASAPAVNIRQIDSCIAGESNIAMGVGPKGEVAPVQVFQITAYDSDSDSNQSSAAAVDTVFKL